MQFQNSGTGALWVFLYGTAIPIKGTNNHNIRRNIEVTILNELDSTCGISDEELTRLFKESIRIDDEIRKIKGLPVARYDRETKRAFLEYPDGRREYVGKK